MKNGSIRAMQRAGEKREPLYTMTEIADKLGVNRFTISALSRVYGAMRPEFSGAHTCHGKPHFKLSVARSWWNSLPEDVRERALLR